jgi:hypothetical protein
MEQTQEHSSGGEEEEEAECDGMAAGAGATYCGGSHNPRCVCRRILLSLSEACTQIWVAHLRRCRPLRHRLTS